MPETLLLVGDEPDLLGLLHRILEHDKIEITAASCLEEAWRSLDRASVCVVALRPAGAALDLVRRARAAGSATEFVWLAEAPAVETVVEAMRAGAADVVTRPWHRDRLAGAIAAARERCARTRPAPPAADCGGPLAPNPLLGSSPAMQSVHDLVRRVGPSHSTVLITGESGTGKEIVAAALQQLSRRRDEPFIKVHCAAIPETLMESELFGHEKGAFTGAIRARKGRFELADGGTIFLDEIGDMSLGTQTKLLRVLQEGELDRVGGTSTLKVDVRVIAATNVDLERAVAERRFREDLYYRLKVIEIPLPPLRDRKEDVPLLVEHFLRRASRRNAKRILGLEPDALAALLDHDWPGNVRELENTIERAVVLSSGERIRRADLGGRAESRPAPYSVTFPIGTRLAEIERRMIAETLRYTDGDKTRAARLLGITARTIYRALERRRRELLAAEARPGAPEPACSPPGEGSLAPALADRHGDPD